MLPRDAVAGIPEEYAEAVIDNTLSLVATVTTTDDVLAAWDLTDRRADRRAGVPWRPWRDEP